MGDFPSSNMDLLSRKRRVIRAQVPTRACQESRFGVNPYGKRVFRVDHLYTFFVQWSPDVYGKDAKEQGFVVVEKEELTMIDNFFSEPTTKSWEVRLKRVRLSSLKYKAQTKYSRVQNPSTFGWQEVKISCAPWKSYEGKPSSSV